MSLRNLRRGLAVTHPAVFGAAYSIKALGVPFQVTTPRNGTPKAVGLGYAAGAAGAAASSSVKPRILFGSTGMPGPIVVVNVTFFR
jgi:hypothetical protein